MTVDETVSGCVSGNRATAGRVAIVGAGQAGGDLAAGLRERGFAGEITLFGDEPLPPYHRPPLSKGYLLREKTISDLMVRSADAYHRHGIDVRLGLSVTGIDRVRTCIELEDRSTHPYDALILATGGSARRHPDPRVQSAGNAHSLRTVADVERIRGGLVPGRRLLILGGGYIGLEMAAVAATLGVHTTVVEREERLLARVAPPVISEFFLRLHTERGVDVRLGVSVSDVLCGDSGDIDAVTLDDGSLVNVDLCLVAIGLRPNVDLAVSAGLAVDDGVIVDEYLTSTTDSAVFALGDVARHPCADRGGSRRIESIANASEQARVLAATLSGTPTAHRAVPWFWSDQFDVKYQSVGLHDTDDEIVIRGDSTTGAKFSIFHLRDGALRGADVVSNPAEFALARKLVSQRAEVSAAALANTDVSLRDAAARSREIA